ncbi:MAG: hypothetical protein SO292_04140 [Bacilli bacterium]|nr:hypothetical protein [Bacilli bacterium]
MSIKSKVEQNTNVIKNINPKIAKLNNFVRPLSELGYNTNKLQEKTVTPSLSTQVVTADDGYYALSKVTVLRREDDSLLDSNNAYGVYIDQDHLWIEHDFSSDSGNVYLTADNSVKVRDCAVNVEVEEGGSVTATNLTASNIKKGVTILGVTGTLNLGSPTIITPVVQEKSVTPTKQSQEVTPDVGYTHLSKVIVNPIPDEFVVPIGKLPITSNGTYSVTNYATVEVSVPTTTVPDTVTISAGEEVPYPPSEVQNQAWFIIKDTSNNKYELYTTPFGWGRYNSRYYCIKQNGTEIDGNSDYQYTVYYLVIGTSSGWTYSGSGYSNTQARALHAEASNVDIYNWTNLVTKSTTIHFSKNSD